MLRFAAAHEAYTTYLPDVQSTSAFVSYKTIKNTTS